MIDDRLALMRTRRAPSFDYTSVVVAAVAAVVGLVVGTRVVVVLV